MSAQPEPVMSEAELEERKQQYAATLRAQRRAAADPELMALLRARIAADNEERSSSSK